MTNPDDPQAAEAIGYVTQVRAKTKRSAAKLALVRGKAVSQDGSVRVEVNSTGQLTDLVLTDKALGLGAVRLAQQIRATAVAAIHNTSEARAEAMAELTEDPRVGDALARFRELIPPTPDREDTHHDDEAGDADEDPYWNSGRDRFSLHPQDEE